jgi:hypothetical protein
MKRALIVIAILSGSIVVYAQDKPEPLVNRELIFDVIHICATIAVIYLISSFILQLLRRNLDFRLKMKIVERQTDEQIVSKIVEPDRANTMNTVLQWICALAGVGAGLLIMDATRPFGMHSLAFMAFSVAAGLGAYYLLAKRTKK